MYREGAIPARPLLLFGPVFDQNHRFPSGKEGVVHGLLTLLDDPEAAPLGPTS